jgi:polar amino acid transport system substrate-binding protein
MEKVLTREIKKSLRKQTIFSVIILDIDFFKSINDTYGHMIGDKVLKQVAQKIQANIRDTDWVGRWGGEEFMIVCEHTNEQEAYLLADKMRKIINSEKIEETNVTVSLGVSQYNQNDTNWDQVVTRADDALYIAKNSGRDSVKIFRSQNV